MEIQKKIGESEEPLPEFFDPIVYNAESMYTVRGALDPAMHLEGYHLVWMANCYEGLVKYRGSNRPEDWSIIGNLATEWEISEDGKHYTFYLRQGVKFHDGTPFNASAVKFSFERAIALQGGPGGLISPIKTIDVVDEYTVRLNLYDPYRPLLSILAAHPGKCIVSPTYIEEHSTSADPFATAWMEAHICGTGPYTLKELVIEKHLVLQKFDDYWGGWEPIEGEYPRIETINYIQVRDYSTAKLMLVRGELDTLEHYTPAELDIIDALSETEVDLMESWRLYQWLFNAKRPPTDNIYVRLAIAYACNYDQLVNEVLDPVAFLAEGPVPSGMKYSEPKSAFKYNLTKARGYLEMAGYPEGEGLPELEIGILAGNEQQRLAAPFLASNLAQIGITLKVIEKPSSAWKTISRDTPEVFPHIYRWANVGAYDDPDCIVYMFFHSSAIPLGGFNFGNYNNTEVDEMIMEGRKIPEEEREAHYSTLLMYLKEDAAATQCYGLFVATLRREWLRGERSYHPSTDRGYYAYTMYKSVEG